MVNRKRHRNSAISELEYERFVLSFKAMGVGMWDYNIETDKLFCSDRWYEILGLDHAVAEVNSIESFKVHIHPDDVQVATEIDHAKIAQLLETGEPYRVQFRIIRPTGEIRWVRSVASVISGRSTRQLRAVGCIADITEFQTAEQNVADKPTSRSSSTAHRLKYRARSKSAVGSDDVSLSVKERECLNWISVGKTAWETAIIIGRSRRTVEFHLHNAVVKLKAANVVHAASIAIRRKLL